MHINIWKSIILITLLAKASKTKASSKKGRVEDLSSGEESDAEEEVDEAEEEDNLQVIIVWFFYYW